MKKTLINIKKQIYNLYTKEWLNSIIHPWNSCYLFEDILVYDFKYICHYFHKKGLLYGDKFYEGMREFLTCKGATFGELYYIQKLKWINKVYEKIDYLMPSYDGTYNVIINQNKPYNRAFLTWKQTIDFIFDTIINKTKKDNQEQEAKKLLKTFQELENGEYED